MTLFIRFAAIIAGLAALLCSHAVIAEETDTEVGAEQNTAEEPFEIPPVEDTESVAKVDVRVDGIRDDRLSENVRIYLEAMDKNEADGSERHQYLLRENISKALRVFGYYNSQVYFDLQPRSGKKDLLIASVNVGEPVRIDSTDIEISGEAAEDEEFRKLDKNVPAKGAVLEHEIYDDYKSSLEKLARQRGYFDADFPVHELQVMPSTNQGWWHLVFNSGQRYHYGDISFHGSQIREDYLRNILKIQSGDPYLINDVSGMTSDYSSTNWFQSVLVKPTLHEDSKLVDLAVLLRPRKKNSMELGIGYGSDSGPHTQIGWTRPWINSRGHSVRSNLYISSPKQNFEATYKMPLLKNPLNYYYEFSTGFEHEDDTKTDTQSTAATVAALRFWNHPTGWQYSAGLRARYDNFTQADVDEKTLLIYPTATVSRSRISGGTFADRADTISVTVDLGRKMWASDVNFFRIRANAGWIKTFATNHRFLTRGDIGYLHTDEFNRIPPALRFFAGGDRSVRGYGYKKIAPKDSRNGKLVGGSRLATGTLEYQYQVVQDWWAATFFDAGFAANRFSSDELRYGAGVGVRWASPVGPIKFDIATPVRDKDDSKNIQFYIGLGTEL
ncbi:outer membrane protein assembly factor [Actinobacillus succinogenes]|uniref:Translocation and assembly module subunit TamA n=1 Tax=Actinobacillus succinogenes (strain ATCC 55618 / DSM 22257 / CCUG 43843 / 130Z) TaxID=339671 RepID=A6VL94_ACTSZ|nr:autotransporter assembly complex family protein [Actinobacillus succinogenes]ABR73741.1 surface antigen (D15) [Actinobacillus succinogenes 130Z]PHI39801.1 outer membrane protein assembly factor [Actinobacillus succinogenes]